MFFELRYLTLMRKAHHNAPARALKRVHSRRNLCVRTSAAMAKVGPSRLRPLTLRFLSAPVHALKRAPGAGIGM
ncbi:Putative protein without homology [Lacticaseibacillus rhamnosus Lc 705]|nr:Putative protein without homology [Lacticaseibacillus rhamnosus Lc 705]